MEIEVGYTLRKVVERPVCISYNATCLRFELRLYKDDKAPFYLGEEQQEQFK